MKGAMRIVSTEMRRRPSAALGVGLTVAVAAVERHLSLSHDRDIRACCADVLDEMGG
jgi:hypothetical protein